VKPGDVVEVLLAEIALTGEAVAPIEGGRLLVPGALPGERARVRVLRESEGDVHAELLELRGVSPQRVAPACRHAAECGGCGWQHVAYPEQLRLKRHILERQLEKSLGRRAPVVSPTVGMPTGPDGRPWGFRQKAAFVFGTDALGGLAMGHFARGTNRLVPVSECPVHAERGNRVAFALRDALTRARIPAADSGRGGLLRHVLVRTSADEREAVAVVVAVDNHPRLRAPLQRVLASPERPTGLMLNLHARPGPYMLGSETLRVDGPGHVREEALGPAFLVSPTGFFQTNVGAAADLLHLVTAALPPRPGLRILDLYSGAGLFALPLAQRGHTVTAVEESRKASRDAARNGKLNHVPQERLNLLCGRVEDSLTRLGRERWDVAILDPPRPGCPPQVMRFVAERLRPETLILVSCNPEALARELPLALRAGYRALRVQPVDMFPHTPHIETVVVLGRPAAGTRHAGGGPVGRRPPARRPANRRSR
jgi:23S rRNA (uracil1939-C5)-methyltransferase